MREIKFRAWNKKQKKMYDGNDIISVIGVPGIVNEEQICYRLNEHFERLQKQFILMEYVGFKDKRGKEVYEGDVVQFDVVGENHVSFDKKKKEQIRYHENQVIGELQIKAEYTLFDYEPLNNCCQFEVIGNIYENPNLLQEEKNEN